MIRDSSFLSYQEAINTGAIGEQCQRIAEAVIEANQPVTRRELELLTGISISSISGRVNEMVKLGILKELDLSICPITGRRVHPLIAA